MTSAEVLAASRRDGTLGRWLRAGTPAWQAYPCMCRGTRACGLRCVCRGRADWQLMDSKCCARKQGETQARQENQGGS